MRSLREIFNLASLHLSKKEEILLNTFISFLKDWNKKINLFAHCSEETLHVKHILDSAYGASFIDEKKSLNIMDLGTGGGLPGIVLAILRPLSHFTLVDSTKKKVDVVHQMVDYLQLSNVDCSWGRSEILASDPMFHGKYDMVVARAFAPLNRLIPATFPFLKPRGQIMAYKGPNITSEFFQCEHLFSMYAVKNMKHFELPFSYGKRTLIIVSRKT